MLTTDTLQKENKLYLILCIVFISTIIIAEIIGVKIFSVEKLLNIEQFNSSIFGIEHIHLDFTAGVLIWPIVFILTDIINEYFGIKGVKFISFLSAIIICYFFIMIKLSISLPSSDWWINKTILSGEIVNRDQAFTMTLSQGQWIIIGSLIAFLIGQLLDAYIFKRLKTYLNGRNIWLRATLSTFASQLIDSFIVLFIAFYIGDNWSFQQIMAVCIVNYLFKSSSAIILSPLIYATQYVIDLYLGKELANKLKQS